MKTTETALAGSIIGPSLLTAIAFLGERSGVEAVQRGVPRDPKPERAQKLADRIRRPGTPRAR